LLGLGVFFLDPYAADAVDGYSHGCGDQDRDHRRAAAPAAVDGRALATFGDDGVMWFGLRSTGVKVCCPAR
jgi:hypothetical protein